MQDFSEQASKYSMNLDGRIVRSYPRISFHGGSAIVYHGTLIPDGTEVAIKSFRGGIPEDTVTLKRILRELHLRSKLCHENIVPLLGISTEFDDTISMIFVWMPLGNAYTYVQDIRNDPRPLLQDVASGLYYLHSHKLGPIVHGDLKGSNVLVSSDRRALLTDFGISILDGSSFTMSVGNIRGGSFRWIAPELLEDCPASMASDVWAFGMTVLELFTRKHPFRECHNTSAVIRMLITGKLPPRPAAELSGFPLTDAWWKICTSCWEFAPSSRPTMEHVTKQVKAAVYSSGPTSTPQMPLAVEQDRSLSDTTHQQQALERSDISSLYSINFNGRINRTSRRCEHLSGAIASVHHGTSIPDGTGVAIKTFRSRVPGSEAELKRIFREVDAWSRLRHENIVPVLGISTEFDSTVSIISPWMPLGNAYIYVQNTDIDPRPLFVDIASGLYYLHSHELGPIVHGDLKGSNVLVSSDHRALLTDFGFSTLNISTFNMTFDAIRVCSSPWMAPELLDGGSASIASDVWAFGMTILELFTREPPIYDSRTVANAFGGLTGGVMPRRPAAYSTQFRLTDTWWEICILCWERDPLFRPTMEEIKERVKAAVLQASPTFSGQTSIVGKFKGRAYGVPRAEDKGDFRSVYPEEQGQQGSTSSEVPALRMSLTDRLIAMRAALKTFQRR